MLPGVDFDMIRRALRVERETRVGPRAKLEELSGITEGTIFKIETGWVDPRTKSAYMPSADHLVRLIEAMPNLTLADFFASLSSGPSLSRRGSTVAMSTRGGVPHAYSSEQRAQVREIAALKLRITRHEMALRQVREAAKDIARLAGVRPKGRTSTGRRA